MHHVAIVLLVLVATALAVYPPVAPRQGSYIWELVISDESGPEAYTGGRTLYDFVSGYMRMESWDEADPSPGINGVTVWDMRESQPIVTIVDEDVNCWVEKLDDNVEAPTPLDFSDYKLVGTKFFNRALTEEWSDGYGGVVYMDVFSRDIVGMGNTSTAEDGEAMFYNIQSWSDIKPDGTAFLVPDTLQCKNLNTTIPPSGAVERRDVAGIAIAKCPLCKKVMPKVLSGLCRGGGTIACRLYPPAMPFCSILVNLACKHTKKISSSKACKVVKAC